jgi:hypothetical protein
MKALIDWGYGSDQGSMDDPVRILPDLKRPLPGMLNLIHKPISTTLTKE